MSKKTSRFVVTFSPIATGIYAFHVKDQFVPPKFIKPCCLLHNLTT